MGFERLGAVVSREVRRPHFLVMLCMGPLAAAAIAVLDAAGLVAPEPIWLIPIVIVVGQIISMSVDIVWQSSPTRGWLHARVAAQAIVVTVTIYLTGWGPGLAVGLLLVGQESLTAAGASSERVVLGWNLSCLLAGELLLTVGFFPSLLPVPEVHGLALLMGVGIAFSFRSLATALREKEESAETIESRERRFRSLVQNAHDLVFVVDATASVTYASPSCSEVLGYEPGALLGAESGSLIHPDDIDTLREVLVHMRATGAPTCEFAIRVRRRDGALRWLEGLATDLLDDPSVGGLVINARDVTERRVREDRQAVVTRLGREALGSTSLEDLLKDAAQETVRTLGVHECRIVGMLDDRKKRVHAFAVNADGGAGAAGTRKSGLETVRVPIGEPQRPLAHIEVVTDRQLTSGAVAFVEAVAGLLLSSIARSRAEEAIRHQALHDPLTGLPNRTLLNDRLEQTIVRAQREQETFALLVVDLDGFKEVNDTLGHPVGDALLVRLGERLVATLRATDTVARLGGDEFGLLLTTLNSSEEALALAQVIIEAMKRPIEVEETQLCLAASIGVAVYPEHGTTTTDLMKHADVAMYEAKRLGKSTALYQESSDAHSAERLTLMSQIGRAIADGQLVVHYQPKVRLRDGCPLGVEALVRWNHPELGLLQPDDFVPLAEQSGAIGPLTATVLRSSIRQVQLWAEQGHPLDLAVNISARTLHDQNLMNGIFEELARGILPPTRLVLEITETAVMANPQGALRSLERLAELGVRVSVDDFGTGYCSLAYLRDLPIHEIKLDRSYIADMCRGGREAALVHSIIDLGERLGLTIIAEGIEDRETLASLIEAGVSLGQGFLFSRPQPAEALGPWLDESAKTRAAEAARPRPVVLAG